MIKKYLGAGLITLLPIAVTLMIITWLFNFFTTPFLGITETFLFTLEGHTGLSLKHHTSLSIFLSRVLALIFLFALTFILGFFGRKYFFNTLMQWGNRIMLRIPFIKSIYRISKEVTGAVFAENTKTFKKTVLIPFPSSDAHTIGFLTGDAPEICKKAGKDIELSVFVSTAPHPLSGFMLLLPKKSLTELDVSVEEAFKYLLSCGIVHPGETKKS